MTERWRIGLLLVVAVAVYANSVQNGFTFDDHSYILGNTAVRSGSLKELFVPTKANNMLRPFTFATFQLEWAARGPRPFAYHLANVLLHAVVTVLLYLLLLNLLEFVPQAPTIALVAALLFAVHPIHTEAVASIVGRAELLAVAFLLAAWILHVQDRQILALVCLLLAMMSKESAICFLPLAVAGDYARGKLKPMGRYVSILVVTVLYLAVFWKLKGNRFGQLSVSFLDNPLASLPVKWRILNAVAIAWRYVWLQIFPAKLSCDYSYNSILLYANWRHHLPAVAAALLVLAIWVWALWAQKNEWFLAGAIYLGGFAVTANVLVATGTIMGERLAYLPSAGFCLLAALLWIRLENRNRTLAWLVLSVILATLAARTVLRNRDWRDNFTLFSTDVKTVPGSIKMHVNYGGELGNRGQLEAARKEFQSALRAYPDFPEAMEAYGLVEFRLGEYQESRRLLEKALSMGNRKENLDYDFRAVNLAATLVQLGLNDEALRLLDQEIQESPQYGRAWSNRAVIRFQRGEQQAARTDAQTALRLDPGNTQAQKVLAMLNGPAPLIPGQ
jgi:protein O-mannosyl-transferase